MKTNRDIIITKASGENVVFSAGKLRKSLEKSGVPSNVIDSTIDHVKQNLYDGITTKKIYQLAFSKLKNHSRVYAGRYNMRKAVMALGPSGFPFEKYVAEILRQKGYSAETDQLIKGHCVTHEVDIVAKKDQTRSLIECKFHNSHGIYCDVKTPLYIHSRFMDIEKEWQDTHASTSVSNEGWLITNTKFSTDSILYGNCAGLKLLGWNHPPGASLQDWIENSGLYPVTCLTSLTKSEKAEIMSKGIVLCKDLSSRQQMLAGMNIPPARVNGILKEAAAISTPKIEGSQFSV